MKEIDCIGYIVGSTVDTITVVLPEKPFGKLKCKLKQKEKVVDADCHDRYELKGFTLTLDDSNSVTDWRFKTVTKLVDKRYFVALLTDQRVIADDGKTYTFWDNKAIHSDKWISQFDWAFSQGRFSTVDNIVLLIKDNTIYGTECSQDYKFRNSWDIEDVLANYLNSHNRYFVNVNEEISKCNSF